MSTSLGIKNSRGHHYGGSQGFSESYFQKLYQVLTVTIREKIPSCCWQMNGKRNHFEICQNTVFSKGQQKLLPEPKRLGFYQSLTNPGEETNSNASHPSCPTKEGTNEKP